METLINKAVSIDFFFFCSKTVFTPVVCLLWSEFVNLLLVCFVYITTNHMRIFSLLIGQVCLGRDNKSKYRKMMLCSGL